MNANTQCIRLLPFFFLKITLKEPRETGLVRYRSPLADDRWLGTGGRPITNLALVKMAIKGQDFTHRHTTVLRRHRRSKENSLFSRYHRLTTTRRKLSFAKIPCSFPSFVADESTLKLDLYFSFL